MTRPNAVSDVDDRGTTASHDRAIRAAARNLLADCDRSAPAGDDLVRYVAGCFDPEADPASTGYVGDVRGPFSDQGVAIAEAVVITRRHRVANHGAPASVWVPFALPLDPVADG